MWIVIYQSVLLYAVLGLFRVWDISSMEWRNSWDQVLPHLFDVSKHMLNKKWSIVAFIYLSSFHFCPAFAQIILPVFSMDFHKLLVHRRYKKKRKMYQCGAESGLPCPMLPWHSVGWYQILRLHCLHFRDFLDMEFGNMDQERVLSVSPSFGWF